MAKVTEPNVNVMRVEFNNLSYSNALLISAEDTALLMGILGRANTLVNSHGADPTFQSGVQSRAVEMSTYPISQLEDIKKATFLGIPYSEYMESKDETKQRTGTSEDPF